jgi:hypothetical protein
MALEHSRSLLLAAGASRRDREDLEQQLDESVVVVNLDPRMPMATLVARVLLTTLRRGLGTLVLDATQLQSDQVDALEEAVAEVDPGRPLQIERRAVASSVSVHVGPSAPRGVIRLVPEGYGAHVASAPSAVIAPRRIGNPLGAVYTAALGAAEVFKYTADVLAERRVLHRHLRFCPVTLSSDLGGAPDLPAEMTIDLALLGVGAIGTGIALALSELSLTGVLLAVDRERFGAENRGTYSIGTAGDVIDQPWKVDLARRTLRQFEVQRFTGEVAELPGLIDAGKVPWFPTVMSGLDSPQSRRDAQRLWPDQLIDGATGDTMVGLYDSVYDVDPCLICRFPERIDGPSGTERIAKQLGLPAELLRDGERLLQDADLVGLAEEKRRQLRAHVGKPICGLARAIGLTPLEAGGFMPSVPFVSLQAACLCVGRLLARHLGVTPPSNLVQYDGLFGPQAATLLVMRRKGDCYCSTRAETIRSVRERRREQKAALSD